MSEKIIFGTWGISGEFGEISDRDVRSTFEYASERGINRFDAALVYGAGRAERLLGEFARGKSDVILATKIPAKIKPDLAEAEPGEIDHFYPWLKVEDMINASRQRLGRIDLLQLHNWHPAWNQNSSTLMDNLARLKENGDLGGIGVSLPNNMELEVPEGFDVVQVPVNLLERWPERSVGTAQVEIWARSMFCHGALSGSLGRDLTADDKRNAKFTPVLRAQVESLLAKYGNDIDLMKRAAFDYVNNLAGVDRMVVGFRNNAHIDEILKWTS